MKATGIVRRIDDLGRVVIPKEIRRTLRIRESDPLEIFTDREGEIILKKYSPLGEMGTFAKQYTESLAQVSGYIAMIMDRDQVIAVSGGMKNSLGKSVSKELEKLVKPGMEVFDIGTGSGILSIIAAKLGAKNIQAVDYDDSVLKIVEENLEQNHVENIVSVGQSDLMQNVHGKANLVIANIIADIIIRLFKQLDEHLEKDGTLLTSGIIEDRIDDVINAGRKNGFAVVKRMENKGWACITFKRASEV